MLGDTPAERREKPRATISYVGGLCDAGCYAPDHSHPLSVRRDDDDYHERRRGDYFKRSEVDFLLSRLIGRGGLRSEWSERCA